MTIEGRLNRDRCQNCREPFTDDLGAHALAPPKVSGDGTTVNVGLGFVHKDLAACREALRRAKRAPIR